jgi:uncharacterized phage protein gp47/JayE
MFTQEELSKRMRDQLYILDPEISLEVGTPERKIIDVVAQSLADIQFDQFIQRYQLDITTKFGQDLDDFVQLFGFARQTARRASGFVTFSRKTPSPTAIFIPSGTQISTTASAVSSQILFITVADGVIPENGTYAEVPIEATIPGEVGNVTANQINRIITKVSDVAIVRNYTSTTGGTNQETDDELKVRFKNNIFRNIAGTDDQFLALAIANQYTNRATVVGPVSKFQEYMTLDASGSASSFNPNSKHVYDFNYYLSTQGNDISRFYTPDIDYVFSVSTTGIPTAQIYAENMRNPAPSGTPVAGTALDEDFLIGNYQYAYTYTYTPGGQSGISPSSNEVTFSNEVGTVTHLYNTSGTSLAGGSVTSKNIYRKDLGATTQIWEKVGEIATHGTFSVSSFERSAGSSGTTIIYLDSGSATLTGIETGGTISVGTVIVGGGTIPPYSGTVHSIGSSSIAYINSVASGTTTVGSASASGTAIVDITAFYDNSSVGVGEPPTDDLAENSIVFLEHEYLSRWSRNVIDLNNNYSSMNKIDIYISGQNTETAEDVTAGPGNLIKDDVTDKYHYENFYRNNTTIHPGTGNYFINSIWTPVRSVPEILNIDGTDYELGADYWLVKDITDLRDSYRCRDGIEITSAMANAIDQSVFSIEYTFDKLPFLTNKIIDSHRQIGQDVLVHTAKFRYFIANLVVIYINGFVVNSVNIDIANNIETFFNGQLFGAVIQLNDILQIIYQTPGVDNVRFATSADDAVHYGLEEVTANGTNINIYEEDFLLENIDLPVFYSLGPNTQGTNSPVAPIQKTQNNWIV